MAIIPHRIVWIFPRERIEIGHLLIGMSGNFVSFILLLTVSNVFMTFAWYGHLKHLGNKPLLLAILVSWGIAFLEYVFQVPANRAGSHVLTLPQMKILQEVITLTVFVPFAVFYMNTPVKLDYLWAALCLAGAVYFIFRSA
jgi:uncharacterized protein (DUF486 family)